MSSAVDLGEALQASPEDLDRSRELRAAIIDIASSKPDGFMSYGEFVQHSLYGVGDDIPGYYTAPGFTPNAENAYSADTFITNARFPGFGKAIGEIIAMEVADLTPDKIDVVEVGGGNGQLMAMMLQGIHQELQSNGQRRTVQPTMIDRTLQLLQRQRSAIEQARIEHVNGNSSITVMEPTIVQADIAQAALETHPIGAVVSNELLDMLPFEVAVRADEDRAEIFGLKVQGKDFKYCSVPVDETLQQDALNALAQKPEADMTSFQPSLLSVFKTLCGLVESGVILAADYGPDCGSDVQVVRNNVVSRPLDEVLFPGLFDISVIPDWSKIIRWARSEYAPEDVEFEPVSKLIRSSSSYGDLVDILDDEHQATFKLFPSREREELKARLCHALAIQLNLHASLIVRK